MDVNNIVDISYAQSGQSSATNALGMREMQAKAYEARGKKYLLIKGVVGTGSVPRAHTSIYKGWLPSNINVSRIPMVFVQHKRNNYQRDGSRSPDVDVQA